VALISTVYALTSMKYITVRPGLIHPSLTSVATRLTMSKKTEDGHKDVTHQSTFDFSSDSETLDRRRMLFVATSLALGLAAQPTKVSAYEKNFPMELTEADPTRKITIGSRSNSRQRATAAVAKAQVRRDKISNFNLKENLLSTFVWAGALWVLSGSRSNPLATPIANWVYDEEQEPWLKDRNSGLFAPLPFPLLLLLGVVFVCLGVVTQYFLLQLSEGDSGVCLQLAGVSLIGGASLELGRIASGEKKSNREDFERETLLRDEFAEFTLKRLLPGGNCHRSDVISAFRRFYSKYRSSESEKYPLTDLEIEQLLRQWNKIAGKAETTSAGFYYGIQINQDADVFGKR
jgi:hypothetical protein